MCVARIVRDYDKYIARQFQRGASRQELNVSWLKKNELELKRHMAELRDSIRNNWSMTGQELTREFRQFWSNSRSNSPARSLRNGHSDATSPTSGTSKSRLSQVDSSNRPDSPGPSNRNEDFATGYTLGLIGGVRSWVRLIFFPFVLWHLLTFSFTQDGTHPHAASKSADIANGERRGP